MNCYYSCTSVFLVIRYVTTQNLMVNKPEENPPKSITEALIEILWVNPYRKALVITGFVLFCVYSIWNSLPDQIKTDLINSSSKHDKEVAYGPAESFWINLSQEWKIIFREQLTTSFEESKNFDTIFSVTEIDLTGSKIQDIKPISNGQFNQVSDLYASPELSSIEGIQNLKNLYFVDLSGSKIQSISELKSLPNLERLNIQNTNIPKDEISTFRIYRPDVKIKE